MAGRLSTIDSWRLKFGRIKMALTYGKPPSSIFGDHLNDVYKYMQQVRNSPILQQDVVNAQQQYSQLQAMNQAQAAAGMANISTPPLDYIALDLLKRRMAGLTSQFTLKQDEFLTCYVSKDTVYVFFVLNGKAGHFIEEVTLFPSDKILTQIRMIR